MSAAERNAVVVRLIPSSLYQPFFMPRKNPMSLEALAMPTRSSTGAWAMAGIGKADAATPARTRRRVIA